MVKLVFLGLLTFAPKISTDVLFAPVMHRSWEEKSSDYDTTSHCLSAWMLYTLEQSQPQCSQTSTYVMKKWYAVEVKNLNLHILIKNTNILCWNCWIEYSLKHGKSKSNLEIKYLGRYVWYILIQILCTFLSVIECTLYYEWHKIRLKLKRGPKF